MHKSAVASVVQLTGLFKEQYDIIAMCLFFYFTAICFIDNHVA